MERTTRRAARILLSIVFSATLLSVGPATVRGQQTSPPRPTICHLLIFADTEDPVTGAGAERDADRVRSLFQEHVAAAQLRVREVRGDQLTRQGLLDAIRSTPVQSRDTLAVYFSGRGAVDRRNGHFLVASPRARSLYERHLLRKTLLRILRAKSARLTVLITECCDHLLTAPANEPQQAEPQQAGKTAALGSGPASGPSSESSQAQTAAAFDSLLFKTSGVVDFRSAGGMQVSLGDTRDGGYFTRAFGDYLQKNAGQPTSWDALFEAVRRSTVQTFKQRHAGGLQFHQDGKLHRQAEQAPSARLQVRSFDNARTSGRSRRRPPTSRGPRLGIRALEQNGQVVITEVLAGSPATRARVSGGQIRQPLTNGDVIRSINGRRVTTERQYSTAVAQSPRTLRMQIVKFDDDRVVDVEVLLAR